MSTSPDDLLERAKRMARRITWQEMVDRGFTALENAGLEPEDIQKLADGTGIPSEDIAYSLSTSLAFGGHLLRHGNADDRIQVPHERAGVEISNASTDELTSERIATALEKLANHFAPPPPDIVDTGYVATRLDCTREYVSQMAKRGDIPRNCVVAGTGWGKTWKFYRSRIDRWIESR